MNTIPDSVSAWAGRRILIVGDLMLDEYICGKVRRLSPEAPVPVLEFEHRTLRPGGAANAAANVQSLGGQVLLGGLVGHDAQGQQLLTALAAAGLDAAGVLRVAERWTTTKTRCLVQSQQVLRLDYERVEPITPAQEDELLGWLDRQVVDAYVLSDYAKGTVSPRLAQHVIQRGRHLDRPVLVDPKGTDYTKYRGATLVKPNSHEVERVLQQGVDTEAEVRAAGQRLLELLPGSTVLITRGAQGLSLFRPGALPVQIAARARQVFDVTGAGDTVTGVLALALAAGVELSVAARLANAAAGLVVGKLGAAQISPEELAALLASR